MSLAMPRYYRMASHQDIAADRGMVIEPRFFIPQDYECRPLDDVAEGVGFEPTEALTPLRFSRPTRSTTLPPLRGSQYSLPRFSRSCEAKEHGGYP
jgi:hypothetical protein